MKYTSCNKCGLELASCRDSKAMPFHKLVNEETVCNKCYIDTREEIDTITSSLNK